MKIYLASFWEPDNHGPGRKIGIAPSKPRNLQEECGYECESQYEGLSPEDVYWDYHKAKKAADDDAEMLKKAGDDFVQGYKDRLSGFKKAVEEAAQKNNSSIFDVIGLEDGDTLLSWERGGHTSYREHTAEFLRGLGYEVEER